MEILSLQAVVPDLQSVKNCAFLRSLSHAGFKKSRSGTNTIEFHILP